jgi:hypothetical protein
MKIILIPDSLIVMWTYTRRYLPTLAAAPWAF